MIGRLRQKSWQYLTVTGLAVVVFVLVLVNLAIYVGNRDLQAQVNGRQQYINQTLALDRLNREIITALANLAARNNDDQLRTLLVEHGITFTVTQTPPPASTPPARGSR